MSVVFIRRPLGLVGVVALVVAWSIGCGRSDPDSTTAPSRGSSSSSVTTAPSATANAAAGYGAPLVLARGVRFTKAPPGDDVPSIVRREREKAAADGRDLVVYLGATWCEPCQRFHHAAQRGELDSEFPELTILEFDLDEDRERVFAAGYQSKLIPLFVLPGEDGRGSERRFEGGVKGDRAVANITPRLRKLIAK